MKTIVVSSLLIVALVAGLIGTLALRRDNAATRARVAQLRSSPPPASLAGTRPTPSPSEVSSSVPASTNDPTRATQLAQLRAEITALEQRAAPSSAHLSPPSAASTSALALSSVSTVSAPTPAPDPEKALTPLEHLQNVGHATPAAAFQTLLWAALKGDDAALARSIAWDDATRPQVEAMIATLPPALREKYPTPELLAALFIAKYTVDVSAIQIAGVTPHDATHATVTVRGLMANDQQLPLRLGPGGWQLLEGPKQLEWLRQELAGKN